MIRPAGVDSASQQNAASQVAASTRITYLPSGAVRYARLAATVLPLTLILATISSGLAWLSIKGWYLVVVMPLVAGICLAPFVVLAVKWAHCRNQTMGLVYGLFLGAALYVGQFPSMLVLAHGWHALPRVETLPALVASTVNDWQLFHRGDAVPVNSLVNWIVFGAELLACALIAGVSGAVVGEQPYCERCGRWMKSTKVRIWPLAGHAVASALQNGTLAELPELLPQTGTSKVSHSCLQIDYCRHYDADDGAFFLTATEVFRNEKDTTILTLFRKTEIMPHEAVAIVSKCHALAIH